MAAVSNWTRLTGTGSIFRVDPEERRDGLTGTPSEKASGKEKMAAVKEVCIKANADGFVTSLPQGYDTPVGERGFFALWRTEAADCDRQGDSLEPIDLTSG